MMVKSKQTELRTMLQSRKEVDLLCLNFLEEVLVGLNLGV